MYFFNNPETTKKDETTTVDFGRIQVKPSRREDVAIGLNNWLIENAKALLGEDIWIDFSLNGEVSFTVHLRDGEDWADHIVKLQESLTDYEYRKLLKKEPDPIVIELIES